MKLTIMSFQVYVFLIFNCICHAQPSNLHSLSEIRFNDCNAADQFNKVYLLGSGEEVIVKNYCTEEIAIGLRKYLDISTNLAFIYQQRDSITIGLISQYKSIDSVVSDISDSLTLISGKLKNISDINLQPSIERLDSSSNKLKDSNAQLDSAKKRLDEIKSDLETIQIKNFLKDLLYGSVCIFGGVLLGHYVWKR